MQSDSRVGQVVAQCKFDLLACVGAKAELIADAAEQSGMDIGAILQKYFEAARRASGEAR